MLGLDSNALLIVLSAVTLLAVLAIISYRLGRTASIFICTFIELLALSISQFGSVLGISMVHRFLIGGIFLSLLPAAILSAYLLQGIRSARALLIAMLVGLVGYTLAWTGGLSVSPLFGDVPLEVLSIREAWMIGILGILAETAGFYTVVPLYSFLGRNLRFPHWARVMATLAFVPLVNGVIMALGLLYPPMSEYATVLATTVAARVVTGLWLLPGVLILLRAHVAEPDDALRVGPLDALAQLTATRRSLEEVEARYRAMFAAAPDAILLFDNSGVIREINQRGEQLLGYEPGKLVGVPVWEIWGPTRDRMEAARRIQVRLQNMPAGHVMNLPGLAQRADGTFLPTEVNLTPIGGTAPGFLAIAHDLTRQRRDREQLERQVAELNTLAEVSHIASSATNVSSLLKASADRVAEIVGSDTCFVTLWDETRQQVVFTAASGAEHESFRTLTPAAQNEGPSLTRAALEDSHPIMVHDFPHSRYFRARLMKDPPIQSMLALPLIGNGQKLGAIMIGHFKPHTFSDEEIDTLQRAANLIALAVARMRLIEQTQERQRVAESLRQLGIAFGSTLDYDEILDRILSGLSRVLDCDAANIQAIQNGTVEVIRSQGYEKFGVQSPDQGPSLSLTDAPLLTAMIETRQPVVLGDVRNDPRWRIPSDWGNRPLFWRSWVGAPVIVRDRVIGFINADSAAENHYTERDAELLALFAAQAAIALENARLYTEASEQRAIAETLRDAAIVLGSTLDTNAILDQILVLLETLVPYDAANIQMICDGRVNLSRTRGYEKYLPDIEQTARDTFFLAQDLPNLREMMRTRQPHCVPDTRNDPSWIKVAGLEWIRSWAAAPIIVNSEVIGFINVDGATPGFHTRRHADQIALFAQQAASALQNAILYTEAQEQRNIAEALREATQVLTGTLDTQEILDRILGLLERVVSCDTSYIRLLKDGKVEMTRARGCEKFGDHTGALEASLPMLDFPNIRAMLASGKPHVIPDTWRDSEWIDVPGLEWVRSWVGAPIVIRGETIGFMGAYSARGSAYSSRHADLLAVFAGHAATALHNARLYEQTERRVRELSALYESGRRLQQLETPESLAQEAVDALADILGYDHGSVMLTDAATGDLVTVALNEQGADKADIDAEMALLAQIGIRVGMGITGWVARRGESVCVGDVSADPRYLAVRKDIQSELCVPLRVGGQVIGVINVESAQPYAYAEADQRLLETVAAQVAVSIQNARLYGQSQRQLQELTAIYEAGHRLRQLLPTEQISREVLDILSQLMDHNYGAILLLDPPTGDLCTVAFQRKGQTVEMVDGDRARATGCTGHLGVGITGWVAQHGESLCIGDVLQDARYHSSRPEMRSELCVPLRAGDQVIGVINLESEQLNAYTEADQRILETVAAQAATAIQNARLYEDLQGAYEQLKTSQAQAMRSERLRALGQMASGIAHDFNNVLTPIMGYLELALEQSDVPENARGDIERARRGALAASGIVARLREFYRPRELAESFQPMDLSRTIQEAVELTRPRWRDIPQEHGVVIDVRLEMEPVPRILGDASALRDLLTNLILNAVDAMPKGGAITIRTRKDRDFALLTVADTGTGLTEEAQQRAFEPFFSTKGSRGTGLGLSICYGIVQRHRGTIDIQSVPGAGVTVLVRLPIAPPAQHPEPQAELPSVPVLRILLVDDEEPVLVVVTRMLRSAGHKVIAAKGGREGIEKFSPEEVDIVITDLGMPQVTGREVARAVKSLSPRTPVILLTGWGAKVGQESGAPREVDDVVTKPVQSTDLQRSLAKVLGLLAPDGTAAKGT